MKFTCSHQQRGRIVANCRGYVANAADLGQLASSLGKIDTKRYEAVNAKGSMDFLKEHAREEQEHGNVPELQAMVGQQQKEI
jgi:hypothetical protein